MKRKMIMTLLVSMICLCACGKADGIEAVMSSAIETDDQQYVEEENIVAEVENIIEEESEQEIEEVDTVGEVDTTSLGNGSGLTITEDESNYFKEAEELFAAYKSELDCNEESFKENFAENRIDGLTKEDAFKIVYEMFKKVEEQPVEQQSTTQVEQPTEQSPAVQPELSTDTFVPQPGQPVVGADPSWGNIIWGEEHGTSDLPDIKAE